jgi:hypothetical protein
MSRLKQIARDKRGNSYILVVFIAIAVLLISYGVYEFIRLKIIAQGVRDAVQSAIISVATGNYDDTYATLREGYSGGYANDGGGFNEKLDLGDVYARLDSLLGLDTAGGKHVKKTSDGVEFSVSNLTVTVANTPLAPFMPNAAQKFQADAVIFLEVPLSYAWSALPQMQINLKCKAGYTAKF